MTVIDSLAPTIADRTSFLEVVWQDPVTKSPGFLVIDRIVRGVSSGGLRMRAGCTLREVRDLARGMTLKEALHYDPDSNYVPLGGAKGGIDCDPRHPDASGVLARYVSAMAPLIKEYWNLGEDLGVRQDAVDSTLRSIGISSAAYAAHRVVNDLEHTTERMNRAFTTWVSGVRLDELVGGLGVAESVLVALERVGLPPHQARASIQGFGSMGGATARYLAEAGVRVVAISDIDGIVTNPSGLDVEHYLSHRDPQGRIDRTLLNSGDRLLPPEFWLTVECDVLVPAAASYCITRENQADVRALIVAEAANMPTTPDAEEALAARGVTILPDFLANSATNAWWWWVFFGDIDGSAEQSFRKVRTSIRALTEAAFDRATSPSLRHAALTQASANLRTIEATYSAFSKVVA